MNTSQLAALALFLEPGIVAVVRNLWERGHNCMSKYLHHSRTTSSLRPFQWKSLCEFRVPRNRSSECILQLKSRRILAYFVHPDSLLQYMLRHIHRDKRCRALLCICVPGNYRTTWHNSFPLGLPGQPSNTDCCQQIDLATCRPHTR